MVALEELERQPLAGEPHGLPLRVGRSPPTGSVSSASLGRRRLRSYQPGSPATPSSANPRNASAKPGSPVSSVVPANSMLRCSIMRRWRSRSRRRSSFSTAARSTPSGAGSRVWGMPGGQQPARRQSPGSCAPPTGSKSSRPASSRCLATACGSSLRQVSRSGTPLCRHHAPTTETAPAAKSRTDLRFRSRRPRDGGRSTASSGPRTSSSSRDTWSSTTLWSRVSRVRIQPGSNRRNSRVFRAT